MVVFGSWCHLTEAASRCTRPISELELNESLSMHHVTAPPSSLFLPRCDRCITDYFRFICPDFGSLRGQEDYDGNISSKLLTIARWIKE
jgi:hypothetical protein